MMELARSGRVIVLRLDEAAIDRAKRGKEPDIAWVGEVCLVAGVPAEDKAP